MASSVIKGIEELITCMICHEIFEDPRILSCGDTYCQKCLVGYARVNGNRFKCSLGHGVTVAASDINALPVNRKIRGLVELYGKRGTIAPSKSLLCAQSVHALIRFSATIKSVRQLSERQGNVAM